MHEVSLVSNIWKSLKDSLKPDELNSLSKIKLKIGTLSCVEPKILETAYKMLVEDTNYHDVKLEFNIIQAEAECPHCGINFKVEHFRFICPQCSQPTNKVIAGEEFLIESVEFHKS